MYNLTDICLMFYLYGFFGWILEVAFFGVTERRFVNRGFLNGPICPIYGVGGTIVVLCLTPLKGNFILLFIGSVLITSILELLTGYVLEKIYHIRWWDYSDKKFNIGGYICLRFSLYWGIACTALMYFIHPLLYDIVIWKLSDTVKLAAIIPLSAVLIADITATVNTLRHLNLRIEKINSIGRRMHELSDNIGKLVYEKTEEAVRKGAELAADERVIELRENVREQQERFEKERRDRRERHETEKQARIERLEAEKRELEERLNLITKEMSAFQRRILKAFPGMDSRGNTGLIKKIKERLKN
ncbi:MAG: putative ABC transporter permease [bacterium]|nr:putative ABC transporter permease [bacterium]